MEDYCILLERHARGGAVFATRQLLRLGCRLDLSDASAARAAGALCTDLLRAAPVEGSFGAGGSGKQEMQLIAFTQAAMGDAAPPAVFAACDALCATAPGADGDASPARLQALGLLAALLQGAGSLARAGGPAPLRDIQTRLVIPALQSESVPLRREAVRSLGLLMLLEAEPDAHLLSLLRSAAAHDKRPVRTHAVRALCDLALLHGLEKLGHTLPPAQPGDAGDPAAAPLPAALLGWLMEPSAGLASGSLLEEEEEEEVPSVAAEGLAKLLLGADDEAEPLLPAEALARLLALHQASDEHRHPRLSQCLTVFLPTFAAAGDARQRRLAAATLPALRLGVGKKWLPKLAAFLSQLLRSSSADGSADVGCEALVAELFSEAHHVRHACRSPSRDAYASLPQVHAQFSKGAKPFLSALVRTACAVPLRAPDVLTGEGAKAVQAQAELLRRLSALARSLRTTADKPLAKELDGWEKRMRALPGALSEAPSDALAQEVQATLEASRAEWALLVGCSLPLASSRPTRPARRGAAVVVGSDESEEEEEEEDGTTEEDDDE